MSNIDEIIQYLIVAAICGFSIYTFNAHRIKKFTIWHMMGIIGIALIPTINFFVGLVSMFVFVIESFTSGDYRGSGDV